MPNGRRRYKRQYRVPVVPGGRTPAGSIFKHPAVQQIAQDLGGAAGGAAAYQIYQTVKDEFGKTAIKRKQGTLTQAKTGDVHFLKRTVFGAKQSSYWEQWNKQHGHTRTIETEAGEIDIRQSEQTWAPFGTGSWRDTMNQTQMLALIGANNWDRIHINWVKHTVMMNNPNNSTLIVYLYDLDCRKTSEFRPHNIITADVVAMGGAGLDIYAWGLSLNDFPRLHEFWKVQKTAKVVLEPGETLQYDYYCRYNKTYTNFEVNFAAGDEYSPSLKSRILQVKVTGVPLRLDTDLDTALGADDMKLTWTESWKVEYLANVDEGVEEDVVITQGMGLGAVKVQSKHTEQVETVAD